MTGILFDGIDEPGLHTLAATASAAATSRCARCSTMQPEEVTEELMASGLRGRGGAGFPSGKKISFIPKANVDKYLVCNADESEPGTFKDRELMQKSPHMLIEGMVIAAYAAGANKSFIYIRGEYVEQADIIDAAIVEARDAGLVGEHPRLGLRCRRPPRRGRLHLRRGDRAARLARGQARQPAPEAAVSRQPGPLPGADGHQQRRDADERAAHHRDGRRGVREDRHRELDRHEARQRVGQRPPARQLRGRARDAVARDHLRPRRRPAGGSRGQVLVPRRLVRAGPDGRRRPRPPVRLRHAGEGRLDARLGRDHRRRRLGPGRRRRAEAREVLPPRVVRQVHAVPRGDALDGVDARARAIGPRDPDGPRHHGLGPGADHRQLPVRARRRDGDADRLDGREVPRRVRGAHRGGARAQRPRHGDPAGQPRPPRGPVSAGRPDGRRPHGRWPSPCHGPRSRS